MGRRITRRYGLNNMNQSDIIGWVVVWIVVPAYAMIVCPILWAVEKYEDWKYGEVIEI